MLTGPLLIIGGGDHARVVIDLARTLGHRVVGYVADHPSERIDVNFQWLGSLDGSATWMSRVGASEFTVAIGDNTHRADAYHRATQLGLKAAGLVHPTAVILAGAIIEPGAQVCAAAVIGVDARVCENAIINTGASVDHDCVIHPHAFLGPGARLAGRVTVNEGAHVGIGASVKEGVAIGAWSVVGAGAAVVADISDGLRVGGVPARQLAQPARE